MKLICYPTSGEVPAIVPAPMERQWMEDTPHRFAYRCLPLNIANAHGWQILNRVAFVAEWSGDPALDAVRIDPTERDQVPVLAASHFGHGVLTFGVNCLFRTEPGYDLWVTGPTNTFKDGIQPMCGVVETDWSPFTFTMNWRFTRRNTPVAFEDGEPFCMLFPVRRGLVESVEPEFRSLSADAAVESAYRAWADSRASFIADLKVPGSQAHEDRWQKDYFRGGGGFGTAPKDHRSKLRVKPFK